MTRADKIIEELEGQVARLMGELGKALKRIAKLEKALKKARKG